ncbi:MAG: MauE/DoxX family redox-associated membrane protein [Candidatus Lernaella stagnicola]|nr:MauE/DoxX family redox-associated membrane protein [Candidatus Lernaella stagnicola]
MKKLQTILINPWLIFPLRWLIGGLFLVAAVPKIMDPDAFSLAVDNYRFLPRQFVNLWALFLPWTELFVGLFLVMGPGGRRPFHRLTEAAALLSALMYFSFFTALSWALAHGFDISCGCFRPEGGTDTISWFYLLRDSSLFVASLIVISYHPKMVAKAQ